jgi:oligopeptide/dipeptide ABC transporter ATP-binding protein
MTAEGFRPVEPLLDVKDLKVEFRSRQGTVKAVDGVTFQLMPGEVLGIVGESGSGKSITVRAAMQLLPQAATLSGGSIRFRPKGEAPVEIVGADRNGALMRSLRGRHIGMVFQEPMTALSPVHSIGSQIMTPLRLHLSMSKADARKRAKELLELVQMPRAEQLLDAYPHQLSGGMRQRAMIALALSCNPSLLIADEPTTALDVTTEAQILELLRELRRELGMAIVFITHNFGVVADIADRVAVMYLGRLAEQAPLDDIFYGPRHPYTKALLASVPRIGSGEKARLATIPGMMPDPYALPTGCLFHPRCAEAMAGTCDAARPILAQPGPNRSVSCHLVANTAEDA